ncbi:DeoR/GlpR family DNA-binding transcription regulator [Bacillus sp. FJAT-29790]|uniref:DeoR/GlpR family DNA-binding transcription regulator n=1 Tax=Bacillus sp. FJAT-29790 TaxID=1895002 RepID=UPI001C24B9A9|nr:DeoR/GlpR family DNA-binding transcription regulator [Bacillus sp. FJAT-29790]MBU8879267.1 DeoR/GlpR family DNA-binding transcription regulator [Bacillus sp. FJAT-29790]
MIKTKRIQQIEDYVFEHQTVSLDELVKVFDVSKNTIRRDIQELVELGEIKKVYGGVAVNDTTLVSFSDRKSRNQKQKELIAKSAATYVEDGDVIFIDSGTTTLEMIEFIKVKNLTIITNNLDFILNARPYENLNVISTGGVLERKTNSFVSFKKNDLLKSYNINKAFMASTGISSSYNVTNASPLESEIKQTAVERSSKVFLLVDHGKFGKYGLMTYCGLDEIDYLITDKIPSEDYQEYAKKNEIQLVIADESI